MSRFHLKFFSHILKKYTSRKASLNILFFPTDVSTVIFIDELKPFLHRKTIKQLAFDDYGYHVIALKRR